MISRKSFLLSAIASVASLFGLPKKTKPEEVARDVFLYDWVHCCSDDPGMWEEIGSVLCMKSKFWNVKSVSVNGVFLEDPSSVSVVKSGPRGFVVKAITLGPSHDSSHYGHAMVVKPGAWLSTTQDGDTLVAVLSDRPILYECLYGDVEIEFDDKVA